jgi:hypothetical protein
MPPKVSRVFPRVRAALLATAAVTTVTAAVCGAGPATGTAAPAAAGGRAAVRTTAAVSKPRTWWHPADTGPDNGPEFQWELDHALNIHSASDMGTGRRNALGRLSPRPTVYDIDGIDNPLSTVTALHKMGDRVICYIEVGAAGNYYSAPEEHLRKTYYAQLADAHDLGKGVPGYPERYLNINTASTLSIIKSMIRQQCAAKGFDAVEPDIDDSYTDSTGFRITEAENIRYDRALGAYAHSLGLAWGQKNGDNDPAFSAALEPTTDFLLDEECVFYDTCQIVAPPYLRARKLVIDAEYTADWGPGVSADLRKFCPSDVAGHIDGTLFTVALAGQRNPCR